MWTDRTASVTAFGGERNYDFWQTIFETGSTPGGTRVLPPKIDLMEMIKDKA